MAWSSVIHLLRRQPSSCSLEGNSSPSAHRRLDEDNCPHRRRLKKGDTNRTLLLSPSTSALEDIETASASSHKLQVSFSTVHVRRYHPILGDNPFVEYPLSLGWEYQDDDVHADVTLDEHEALRQEERIPARDLEPTTVTERRLRLLQAGHSEAQLRLEERRRKVQLALEWAYRMNREEQPVCTCRHAALWVQRYVV